MFLRVVDSIEEATTLFILRNVEEELEDLRAVASQVRFELVDVVIAALPKRLVDLHIGNPLRRQQLRMDLDHEDFLIVRPVEDPDLPASRYRLPRPPEEVVVQVLRAWLLERRD